MLAPTRLAAGDDRSGPGGGPGAVRTCSRSLVETKPASVNLLRRFSIQQKAHASWAVCSASTMFEENPPDQILLGRSFDFRYPATRTVRQDSHTSSGGLPRTACLPAVTRRGGWVALVVTVFAQAYEFSRSRRPGLRRYADVHGPLAEVHRARSHSGSVIAVIAWTATLTHPSGAPLGHGKVR